MSYILILVSFQTIYSFNYDCTGCPTKKVTVSMIMYLMLLTLHPIFFRWFKEMRHAKASALF